MSFIEYEGNDVTRPLYVKLSQMIRHTKYFDSNNTMSFKVSDKKLFKNYAKIWEKITSLIGEEFDSESVYGDNDKYIHIKAKIRHATPAVTLFLILPMLLM